MVTRNPNLREKFLDGETLYRQYYEGGMTISTLTEWAMAEGMLSSGGAAPTQMGVWKAMWRWASYGENRELAWEIYQNHDGRMTYEQWVHNMHETIRTAWQFKNPFKYERFLRNNGWK